MQLDQLSPLTGEFQVGERERSFRAERLPETVWHTRIIFALSMVLNLCLLINDWRLYGQPNFPVVVGARCAAIAIAFACFLTIERVKSVRGAAILAWTSVTGLAVGLLMSSHREIALFATIVLPSIYWLAVPASFRTVAGSAISCSVIMLAFYFVNANEASTAFGHGVAILLLNAFLCVVVTRSNRLRRLEWSATQSERQAKEELAESRRTLQHMLACVPVPLVVASKSDGRIVQANEAAIAFLGGNPQDIGIRTLGDLRADKSHPVQSLAATPGKPHGFEGIIKVADGTTRDVLVAARAITIDGEEKILVAGLDITDRKQLERRLERLATTDSLTGLANRAGFFAAATREIAGARRSGRMPALLMVDMDHFKKINDTHGHETGDLVLKSFATLCRRVFRSRDVISRIGGEEFVILLPQMDAPTALARAERLRAAAERLHFRGRASELRVTASIGVAHIRDGENGADAALSRADRALYAAKRAGRNRVMHADAATSMSEVA